MKYVILLASLTIANVHANECGNKKTVFQCNTENNKTLAVCGEGEELFYRFGNIGKSPEKTIKRAINHVDYTLWDGYGSAAKQSMNFNEGDYSYRVFSKYQRLLNGVPTQRVDVDFDTVASGGVQVINGKKVLAAVKCKTEKMVDNIENYKLGEPLEPLTESKPKTNDNCEGTVFSCTTKTKKMIKVCKTATDYIYQYGKVGKKPELTLKRKHGDVIKTPWNGMGNSMTQSIGFAHRSAIYSVFSSMERGESGALSGGVLVNLGGEEDISIDCKKGSIKDSIIDEVE